MVSSVLLVVHCTRIVHLYTVVSGTFVLQLACLVIFTTKDSLIQGYSQQQMKNCELCVVLTALLSRVAVYSENGRTSQRLTFPDSITSWSLQAVGVSATSGMCVVTPGNVTVFKAYLLQLDMPYSVVNGEQVEIKATLYNYRDENLTVGVEAMLLSHYLFPASSELKLWCKT